MFPLQLLLKSDSTDAACACQQGLPYSSISIPLTMMLELYLTT